MCDSNRSTVCLKIVSITPYNWTQYSKFDAVFHRYSVSRLFGVVHIFYAHTGQADLARSVSVLGASALLLAPGAQLWHAAGRPGFRGVHH